MTLSILDRCGGPRCEDCHPHRCACGTTERVHCLDDECDGTGTCRTCFEAEPSPTCGECGCPESDRARCSCECHADPDGERERQLDRQWDREIGGGL